MKIKTNKLSFFLIILIITGCSKIKKKETIEIHQYDVYNNMEIITKPHIIDVYSENVNIFEKNNITDFFFNELMNGNNDLTFRSGEYGVIEYFGEPLKISVQPFLFFFENERVVERHEYTYDDFIHFYYVFESGQKMYNGFTVDKKLERLKTINIGDTSDKLLLAFSDKYQTWEKITTIKENITYYIHDINSSNYPIICIIEFVIKDTIIQEIFVNFLISYV